MPAPAPESPAPPAPAADLTSEQLFEVYGWALGDGKQEQLGLAAAESDAMARGFAASVRGEPPPAWFQAAVPIAQQFLNDRVRKAQEGVAEANRAEEAKFLATVDQNPAVKQTPSGLRYEILEPGTDPKPTAADTVVAHYTLMLPDGRVLESSRDSGQPPEFALNAVVRAWTEGLQLIGKGGKMKLYVPSRLGYGDRGQPPDIPPAQLLIFDVELVEVKQAPAQFPGVPAPTATPPPTPAPAP